MFFGCLPCCGGDCELDYPVSDVASYAASGSVSVQISGTSVGSTVNHSLAEPFTVAWPAGQSSGGSWPANSYQTVGLAGSIAAFGWNLNIRVLSVSQPTATNGGIGVAVTLGQNIGFPDLLPEHRLSESRGDDFISSAIGRVPISVHQLYIIEASAGLYGGSTTTLYNMAGLSLARLLNGTRVLTNLGTGSSNLFFRSYAANDVIQCNALPIQMHYENLGTSFTTASGTESHSLDVVTTVTLADFIWLDSSGGVHQALHAPQIANTAGYPDYIFAGFPSYPPPY